MSHSASAALGKAMGQRLSRSKSKSKNNSRSKSKNKGKGKEKQKKKKKKKKKSKREDRPTLEDRGVVALGEVPPRWVLVRPSSRASFTYSPIRRRGRQSLLQVTEITEKMRRPYLTKAP